MKRFFLFFGIIHLVLLIPIKTKAQFSIMGEIRPRTEFRNGFKTTRDTDTDPAFFVEQRSRIYLHFQREKLEFQVTAQDIRIWGTADQIYKSDPSLTNLFEAWARYNFAGNWWIKVGRQSISYDNQRFLGGLDWAQQGRSHDAAMVTYQNGTKGITLDMAFAFNQNFSFEPARLSGTEYFGTANYKTMQYARIKKDFESGGLSVLFHNDGQQTADTSMAYRQTIGAYTSWDLGSVSVGGGIYFQVGKNAAKKQGSGVLLAAFITAKTKLTPITLGVDYLSGTSYDEQEKDKSFSPLYGTNHKFYGYMDYFYVGNAHGQGGNLGGLVDLYVNTNFKLGEKSSLAADFHYFASPVAVYETAQYVDEISRSLGPEIDLVYSIKMAKDATFWLGYSHIFPSESMVALKRGVGDTSAMHNWVWAMIQFKPTLFLSEK